MSPGRHAADDGSFTRSAGGAAFRGAILLALAVLLGTILLQATDDDGDPFDRPVQAGSDAAVQTTTTVADQTGGDDGDEPSVRPPAQVKVLALNASGVSGVANKATTAIQRAGYQVAPAGNATNPTRASGSLVFHTPGFEAEARQLALGLGLAESSVQPVPSPPPAANLEGANVVVLIGPDLAAKLNATGSTTTTASRGATTTTAG